MKPKVMKLRDVERIFRSFGIVLERGKTAGHKRKGHWMLMGSDGTKYPIPAHKGGSEDVFRTYIEGARRAFHLTVEDGITDEDFYGRR
jgi:hypothetical protein